MPLRPIYLLIFLGLANLCLLQAQDSISLNPTEILNTSQSFENFTINDGLPSNRVLDVLEDCFGYFWIATEAGLSRFDGENFVNYYHNPNDTTSLSNNYVNRLAEDSEGQLWVGTQHGLNKLNRKDYTFQRFFHNPYLHTGLPGNSIKAFLPDTAGILWLETANGFLSKLNTLTNHFENFGHTLAYSVYTNYPSYSIKKLNDGNIFCAGRGVFPFIFDIKSNKIQEIDFLKLTAQVPLISTIHEGKNGYNWIGNSANKLLLTDKNFQNPRSYERIGSIYDIVADEQDLLWMGGWSSGLLCLDKERATLTRYRHNNNPSSILSNSINKIFQDAVRNLWLATNGGLSKLPKERAIQHITNPTQSNYFTAIVNGESDTTLWLGTINEGLYRYNPKTGQFTGNWRHPQLVGNRIESLLFDKNGTLWIGPWTGRGFNSLDTKTGKIEKHQLCNYNAWDWWSDILETKNGDLYFNSWGLGPKKWNKKKGQLSDGNFGTYIDYRGSPILITSPNLLKNKIIRNGGSNGIIFYHPVNQKYHFLRPKNNENYPCSDYQNPLQQDKINLLPWKHGNNSINAVAQSLKTIWLATNDGLFETDTSTFETERSILSTDGDTIISLIFSPTANKLYLSSANRLYIANSTTKRLLNNSLLPKKFDSMKGVNLIVSLSNVYIYDKSQVLCYNIQLNQWTIFDNFKEEIKDLSIEKDLVWVATKNEVYQFVNNSQELQRVVLTTKDSLYLKNINSLAINADKTCWIGTENGLFNVNFKESNLKAFFHNPMDTSTVLDNKIHKVRLDDNQDLWIGTPKGLGKYDTEQKKFERHNHLSPDGISSSLTTSILEDKNGHIWIGNSQQSLDRYEPEKGYFEHYFYEPWNPRSLRPDALEHAIHCMHEDQQGRLWIGGGALSLFVPTTNDFTHYTPTGNTPFNQVLSITEDEKGHLWLGTDRGLYAFNIDKETFHFFGKSDNIQGLAFTKAACQMPNGALVIGGKNGFNIIQTERINFNKKDLQLQLVRFMAGEEAYQERLDSLSTIDLAFNNNSFQVETILKPFDKNNQFRYRLKNYEIEWQERKATDRTIVYSNLPSGHYELELQAGTPMGEWQESQLLLPISVATPLWKRWWFVLLTLGSIVALLTYLLNQRNKKRIAEREKNLQLQFMQVKSLEEQMNPHFVFNVLGSMQNLILNNEPEAANNNLVKLATLIRRFLDASVKMKLPEKGIYNNEITLAEEEELLRLYIEFEQLQYKGAFDYELIIPSNIPKEQFTLPPMLIQPFVENAIKHGLLYKKERGFLSVRFSLKEDDELICLIEDDGVGRKQAAFIQAQSVSQFRSHGTKLVAERVEVLNQMGYDIQIDTKDRTEKGTTVRLKINRHYED